MDAAKATITLPIEIPTIHMPSQAAGIFDKALTLILIFVTFIGVVILLNKTSERNTRQNLPQKFIDAVVGFFSRGSNTNSGSDDAVNQSINDSYVQNPYVSK